jgi:hypothetical protein
MNGSAVNEIESRFARLRPADQLGVLERLVHQMRESLGPGQDDWEAGLSAMAADPEMQRELRRINSEFSATEADGLGKPHAN